MARSLPPEVQHEIKTLFLSSGSIKAVTRSTKVSRNAVRRLLRSEGICGHTVMTTSNPTLPPVKSSPEKRLEIIRFSQLEKLFELGKHPGENLEFKKHIMATVEMMAKEFGIEDNTVDVMKLEFAIFQWISFRRFYLMSIEASDKNYCGPFSKAHEKLAKATLRWVDCYQRSSDSFLKIVRDLELKYGRRADCQYGSNNIFVRGDAVKIETK
jgi:hypothetical protein